MAIETKKEQRLAVIISSLFGGLGVLAIVALTFNMTEEKDVIGLVFPPSYDFADVNAVLSNSGGTAIRFGATDNLVVAKFSENNLNKILRLTGAVTAIDPLVAMGCSVSSNQFSRTKL